MLKQIRYFQAVVRTGSFSQAAEECFISQSAISQQIKALEEELGVKLIERQKRKFNVTPAGEYFYKKSLVIVSDYDRLCQETVNIARGEDAALRIGYLKTYGGHEFQTAVAEFSEKHPEVDIHLIAGNHEDLYEAIKNNDVDIVINDQRRAFSNMYVNEVISNLHCYAEIALHNPLSNLEAITTDELKNTPCIIVCSKAQQEIENTYYREIIGVRGDIIFAETLDEARLLVLRNKGYALVDGGGRDSHFNDRIKRITLLHDEKPIERRYCAFWKKTNSGFYVEEFAEMLKEQF